MAGLILLVSRAATAGTVWHVVSFSIYGSSLVALWSVSAVYHSFYHSKTTTVILKQLDHAMIYFLIAGTYTPVCLVVLRGAWGWSLFGTIWALAVSGIILKLIFRFPPKRIIAVFFAFYIIMGWLIVIAWNPLLRVLPHDGVFWLVAGGVFYTVGAMILGWKRPHIMLGFGNHEVWHLFVLAGCSSHFWMMFRYVLYLNL